MTLGPRFKACLWWEHNDVFFFVFPFNLYETYTLEVLMRILGMLATCGMVLGRNDALHDFESCSKSAL